MPVYAQVKDTTIIKFPYTHGTLMAENPFTNYGSDPDLAEIFPQTSLAIENGLKLVEVLFDDEPTYDKSMEICQRNDLPTLVNDQWILGFTVRLMTDDEKTLYETEQCIQNKNKAVILLQETDWVELPTVGDPSQQIHLVNYNDFIQYRIQLRAIAVIPTLNPVWPIKPMEQWTS